MTSKTTYPTLRRDYKPTFIPLGEYDENTDTFQGKLDPETGTRGVAFNPDNLSMAVPVTTTFTSFSSTKSKFLYQVDNEDGEAEYCEPYFQGPTQAVGFWEIHPPPEANKDDKKSKGKKNKKDSDDEEDEEGTEDLMGYQIDYSLTSLKTLKEPTDDEKYFAALVKCIIERVGTCTANFVEMKHDGEFILPSASRTFYKAGKDEDTWLKPLFAHPPTKETAKKKTKKPDITRPKRSYIKLISFGKNAELKVFSKIYGPEDELLNPCNLVGKYGNVEPVFKLDSVFYGAHGPNTSYGGSIQMKLDQCNYTPIIRKETPRFIGSNNTRVSLSEVFFDEENTSKDGKEKEVSPKKLPKDKKPKQVTPIKAKTKVTQSDLDMLDEHIQKEEEEIELDIEEEKPKKPKAKKPVTKKKN